MLNYGKKRGKLIEAAGSPLTVVFVRHAEPVEPSEANDYDPDLTRRGRRQARRLARRLASLRFDHIYMSDLVRAYRTGEALLERHTATPVTITKSLREISSLHFIHGMPEDRHDAAAVERERRNLGHFIAHLRRYHGEGEAVLVVAHGNLIRTLIPLLAGQDPKGSVLIEVNNASVSVLDIWTDGPSILRLVNCVRHLPEKQIT